MSTTRRCRCWRLAPARPRPAGYGPTFATSGRSPAADHRRRERQHQSRPIAEALAAWADETVRKLSRKSELAAAFRYMRGRWPALVRCFDNGRLVLDNNPAERALRGVAIGRKNWLFAGSDAGGRRAAAMYSLIESAKLNGLNPQLYIADLLARIADHPARHIADLLPWNWTPPRLPALLPEGAQFVGHRPRYSYGYSLI